MARTLDAVVAEMEAAPGDLVPTCDAISHGSLMGARGNSGVILSQIMRGIASTLKGTGEADRGHRRRGAAGRHGGRLQGRAHARRGHDPHRGARQRRRCSVRPPAAGRPSPASCGLLATPGRAALEATPDLLPVLKEAGVVDAGGAGYLLLLDAALHVIDGEPLPEAPERRRRAAPPAVRGRGRLADQRHPLRGDVLLRSARRAHRGAQAGLGSDRRLHRRGRWGRDLELPRPHQRHRRRHRGRPRPRRPAPADPGHRPVRGGRRRARRARGPARRRIIRDRRRLRAARRHVRGRRGEQRRGDQRAVPRARRAGHRPRRADDEPVDGRAARRRRARQLRPRRRPARKQEHHPRRRAARRAHHQDRPGRARPDRCPRGWPR